MNHGLVVREEAEADLLASSLWYAEHLPGRQELFLKAVNEVFAFIQRSPNGPARINSRFRQIPLKGFPYLVVYTIVGHDVVVSRVFHMRRDPKTKLRMRRSK